MLAVHALVTLACLQVQGQQGQRALWGMMIGLTHIDELGTAWKEKSSEEVIRHLYSHVKISWSSIVVSLYSMVIAGVGCFAWDANAS